MSWGPNSFKIRHAAAAALLLATASAAIADVLVVRASGPSAKSFPAGRRLPDNAKISLQANDQLVILKGTATRTLRGPGTFTPSGPIAASAPTQVAANPHRRARIGAVRGGGLSAPKSPSLWHVDVTRSSNFCFADPAKISLWRADATKPVTLSVAGSGATRKLDWAAGQPTIGWPSDLPVREGADYSLSWDGAPKPTALKFRLLQDKPANPQIIATSLIERGCEQQLDLLIATMPAETGAPSAG